MTNESILSRLSMTAQSYLDHTINVKNWQVCVIEQNCLGSSSTHNNFFLKNNSSYQIMYRTMSCAKNLREIHAAVQTMPFNQLVLALMMEITDPRKACGLQRHLSLHALHHNGKLPCFGLTGLFDCDCPE